MSEVSPAPAAPAKKLKLTLILIALTSLLLTCGCCCGIGWYFGEKGIQEDRKKFDDANASWAAGQKPEAVAKYKYLIDQSHMQKTERTLMFQRIIDFDAEKDDKASITEMVEKAEKAKITFIPETDKGKAAVAVVHRERAEREAAERAERERQLAEKEEQRKKKEAERVAEQQRREAEKKKKEEERLAEIERKKAELEKRQAAEKGPPDQVEFVRTVESFFSPYKSAENELKQSALRAERRDAVRKLLKDYQISNWAGTLVNMGTNSEGKAYVEVKLGGATGVVIKTWNNALSDISHKTLIPNGSPLYNSVSNLAKGDKVVFSGVLVPDDRDGIAESSVTERGSMTSPAYIMRFTEMKKQ